MAEFRADPLPPDALPSPPMPRRAPSARPAPRRQEQELHLPTILNRLRRLSRLDAGVFAEQAQDTSQTLAAVLVAVAAVILAAVGGWLWLLAEVDGLSSGRVALREFFLGSLFAFSLWLLWVVTVQATLRAVFHREAERRTLLRTMGFATLPLAGQVFMVIPAAGFGIAMITLVAWFAASAVATEAACPGASRQEALLANAAGFGLFAVSLSILADLGAMAPGAFARGADLSALI